MPRPGLPQTQNTPVVQGQALPANRAEPNSQAVAPPADPALAGSEQPVERPPGLAQARGVDRPVRPLVREPLSAPAPAVQGTPGGPVRPGHRDTPPTPANIPLSPASAPLAAADAPSTAVDAPSTAANVPFTAASHGALPYSGSGIPIPRAGLPQTPNAPVVQRQAAPGGQTVTLPAGPPAPAGPSEPVQGQPERVRGSRVEPAVQPPARLPASAPSAVEPVAPASVPAVQDASAPGSTVRLEHRDTLPTPSNASLVPANAPLAPAKVPFAIDAPSRAADAPFTAADARFTAAGHGASQDGGNGIPMSRSGVPPTQSVPGVQRQAEPGSQMVAPPAGPALAGSGRPVEGQPGPVQTRRVDRLVHPLGREPSSALAVQGTSEDMVRPGHGGAPPTATDAALTVANAPLAAADAPSTPASAPLAAANVLSTAADLPFAAARLPGGQTARDGEPVVPTTPPPATSSPEPVIVPVPQPSPAEGLPTTAGRLALPATDEPEPLPTVRVTIGRIEVHRVPTRSTSPARRPRPARQTLSLDAYLKAGPGGER
jgi:hypothetical protein